MNIGYALLLALFTSVWASSGDRDENFIQCVQLCNIQNCGASSTFSMPLALQLTCWTCDEDCKYRCMHEITDKHVGLGKPIVQYYGKWPFWRFAGAQEPASVVFSLINLLVHWKGASKLRRRIPDNHPMKRYYQRWSLLAMNMWIWSAVFHVRDRPITEKLDYFSAALGIMYALYYTILRIFHIYPGSEGTRLILTTHPPKSIHHRVLGAVCTLAYIGHVSYLSLLPRFDYAYHIAFNLAIGLIHNFMWIMYSLPSSMPLIQRFPLKPKSYRPSFVNKAIILTGLTMAATALELFDFPPWFGVIDAHSLWHLATAPIAVAWYDFILEDSLDPSWREQKS